MVSQWRLSDRKSHQVSRTFLNIPTNLKEAAIWVLSTRSLISRSLSLCTNPLVTVSRAPITFGINVTFMFHFFSPSKVPVLILLLGFFQFYSVIGGGCPRCVMVKAMDCRIVVNKFVLQSRY